jgi:hypothetical protein
MDKDNLTNRVETYLSRRNNRKSARLVKDLYVMLMETVIENEVLQKENSILSHQLDMAEKYILH